MLHLFSPFIEKSHQRLRDEFASLVKQAGCAMKKVCLFHQNAVPVALSARKEPPPMIPIACLEFHLDHVHLDRFVLRELLTTLRPTGYQVLRWARWLLSLAWRVTFVHLIPPLPLEAANVSPDTTVRKDHHILFKHLLEPILETKEVPRLVAFVFQAHFRHDQDKLAALHVQQEVPV